MAAIYSNNNFSIAPKGLVYLLLILGLSAIVYAFVLESWILLVAAVCFPAALLLGINCIREPIVSYFVYVLLTSYFSAIYRYSHIEGLSLILDASLLICLFSILLNTVIKRGSFSWKQSLNPLTLCYSLWWIYCILQVLNPNITVDEWIKNRIELFTLPVTFIVSGILLDSIKKLKYVIYFLGIFVITAAFKAYWQKSHGFDSTEIAWLIGGGAWHTHLLQSGIRYFSFFTDAGNFGTIMGVFTVVFSILSFTTQKRYARIFFIIVTALSIICMLMSGTRGAAVVPFGGIALYLLLNKKIKAIILSCITLIAAFLFFAYTNIGNSNQFISRFRTAFHPTEDASFNVRIQNQKYIAYYLQNKPFGVGLGKDILDSKNFMENSTEAYIPTDSYYVQIWAQTGIVGLCLYIAVLATILIYGCYIILFRIQDYELRSALTAFLCGIFGLWLSGYVGMGMAFHNGNILTAMFLSFVLNGPLIEKKLKREAVLKKLTSVK